MLTILHVINSLGKGGAEVSLVKLIKSDSFNRNVVVSLMGGGELESDLVEAGIEVVSLECLRGRITLGAVIRLGKLIRRFRPDVVQTWLYHSDFLGGVVAKVLGIKKIFWNIRHSFLGPETAKKSTIVIARLCALLSGWVPNRIVCCAYVAADAHEKMGYKKEKMIVIQNGYDLSIFRPDPDCGIEWRSRLGVRSDQFVIGCVARFDPCKDHATLIRAVSLLKKMCNNFVVLLIGKGMTSDNSVLCEMLADADVLEEIKLIGPQDDVRGLMNALDIHALSSSSEGFPNVIAEAMACGTPCVSTDVGDARYIVGDNGWIVQRCQPNLLADALHDAYRKYQDKAGWHERKVAAIGIIQQGYSLQSMSDCYLKLWNS